MVLGNGEPQTRFCQDVVVVGRCVPSHGPAAARAPLVRLDCETSSEVGAPYRRMAGLAELFRTKLGARALGRALDAEGGAVVHVSVRHSWRWERPHEQANRLRWRVWGEEECRRVHTTLRGELVAQVHAQFRGGDLTARWGALQDPLKRAQLTVCWPNTREGAFTESPTGSTLRPLEAGRRAWSVSCGWASPEAAARLASHVRNLLAAYVHAQCIPSDSIFAELGFKTAAEIYASDTPGRMASSLGSVLSPSVAATIHTMMERHRACDEAEIATMASDLMAISTQVSRKRGDVGMEEAADGPSLWLWMQHSAPVGRLVSLIAMSMARLESLQEMSVLWVDICALVRQHWDQRKALPHMDVIRILDGRTGGELDHPDRRLCLLGQKMQMLSLCIWNWSDDGGSGCVAAHGDGLHLDPFLEGSPTELDFEEKCGRGRRVEEEEKERGGGQVRGEIPGAKGRGTAAAGNSNTQAQGPLAGVDPSPTGAGRHLRRLGNGRSILVVKHPQYAQMTDAQVETLRQRQDEERRVGADDAKSLARAVVLKERAALVAKAARRLNTGGTALMATKAVAPSTTFEDIDGSDSEIVEVFRPTAAGEAAESGGESGDKFFDAARGRNISATSLASAAAERQRGGGESTAKLEGCGSAPPEPNMVSLATYEVIVAPALQEVCPLTSDMVRQQQHLLSQMQAGDAAFAQVHQQLRLAKLRSDMQAFKAANVGCVFADFVRWYAPQSWVTEDLSVAAMASSTVSVADDVVLVWPGQGRVNIEERADGSLVAGVNPEWLELWASNPPLAAAQQKPLFNVPQEAEKVLHYLETISPAHLLCQMLMAAIASAHFMLAEAATDATELAPVSAAIAKLGRSGEEAIDALRESAGGGKTGDDGSSHLGAAEGSTTSAVSQSALIACDRFCDETAALELLLSRATSLLCKLPGRVDLVERLLGAGGVRRGGRRGACGPSGAAWYVWLWCDGGRRTSFRCV